MRFLVTGVLDEGVALDDDLLARYLGTIEMLQAWHHDGHVEWYEFFADRVGGCAVFVADSHESLESTLEALPLLDVDTFGLDVTPLVDHDDDALRSLVARQLGTADA